MFSVIFDGRTRVIDLSDLPCPRLVRSMAAQLATIGGQDGTVREWAGFSQMVGQLRSFVAFVAEAESTGAEQFDLGDLEPELLEAFETHLAGRYPPDSLEPHVCMRSVVRLLRMAGETSPGRLSLEMQARVAFASTRSFRPRPKPLDAYPLPVAEAIKAAALADIRRIRDRIAEGERLAATGVDPDVAGWSPLANVLHRVIEQGPLSVHEHGRIRAVRNNHGGVSGVNGHLFLTVADLVPFVVLLIVQTGLEPECVKALRADCLLNPARGFVSIAYVKKRARNASHKTVRVPDGGSLHFPGGLIRLAVRLTARGRQWTGGELLWNDVRCDGVHPTFGTAGSFERKIGDWAASHGLDRLVDRGGGPVRLDLRRLRKTYKSRQYLRTAGMMDDFAAGHSKAVAAAHYADIEAHREVHEQAVEAGLRQALEVALGSPVVADEHGQPLGDGPDLSPPQARAATSTETDVFLASCTDFYASPFARASGSACPVAIWGCVECPNAVYTTRHLPSLLRFVDFIGTQRDELEAGEWQARYGAAFQRITTAILAKFTAEQITTARLIAENDDGHLALPAQILEGIT
ncbi:MAG: hypothetical protein ACYDB7_11985 [Mycobacteriales bacterium]